MPGCSVPESPHPPPPPTNNTQSAIHRCSRARFTSHSHGGLLHSLAHLMWATAPTWKGKAMVLLGFARFHLGFLPPTDANSEVITASPPPTTLPWASAFCSTCRGRGVGEGDRTEDTGDTHSTTQTWRCEFHTVPPHSPPTLHSTWSRAAHSPHAGAHMGDIAREPTLHAATSHQPPATTHVHAPATLGRRDGRSWSYRGRADPCPPPPAR